MGKSMFDSVTYFEIFVLLNSYVVFIVLWLILVVVAIFKKASRPYAGTVLLSLPISLFISSQMALASSEVFNEWPKNPVTILVLWHIWIYFFNIASCLLFLYFTRQRILDNRK